VIGNVVEGGGDVIVCDANSHEDIGRIEGDGWVGHVAFSPTGEEFLVLANPFPDESEADDRATSVVGVINVATLEAVATLDAGSCCLVLAEFSPDGRHVAALRSSPVFQTPPLVLVWDLSAPDKAPVVHDRSDLVGWTSDGTIVTVDPETDAIRFVDPVPRCQDGQRCRSTSRVHRSEPGR
jgi:hypothetical protein